MFTIKKIFLFLTIVSSSTVVCQDDKKSFSDHFKAISQRSFTNCVSFFKGVANVSHHIEFSTQCLKRVPTLFTLKKETPLASKKTLQDHIDAAFEQICKKELEKVDTYKEEQEFITALLETDGARFVDTELSKNISIKEYTFTEIGLLLLQKKYLTHQTLLHQLTTKKNFSPSTPNLSILEAEEATNTILTAIENFSFHFESAKINKLNQVKARQYTSYHPFNDSL